jgi:hypothetical protein
VREDECNLLAVTVSEVSLSYNCHKMHTLEMHNKTFTIPYNFATHIMLPKLFNGKHIQIMIYVKTV